MEFKNYMEQVNYNVSEIVMFNQFPEVSKVFFENEEFPKRLKDDEELEVLQWFAVELRGRYNEEAKRLGIFYDVFTGLLILPVLHYGEIWEDVKPVNYLEDEEVWHFLQGNTKMRKKKTVRGVEDAEIF